MNRRVPAGKLLPSEERGKLAPPGRGRHAGPGGLSVERASKTSN